MESPSPHPSTSDLVDGVLPFVTGFGVLTLALAPLAIPVLALTAVALIPLLLIFLAGALIAAPFLLLRRLYRRAAGPLPVKEASGSGSGRGCRSRTGTVAHSAGRA